MKDSDTKTRPADLPTDLPLEFDLPADTRAYVYIDRLDQLPATMSVDALKHVAPIWLDQGEAEESGAGEYGFELVEGPIGQLVQLVRHAGTPFVVIYRGNFRSWQDGRLVPYMRPVRPDPDLDPDNPPLLSVEDWLYIVADAQGRPRAVVADDRRTYVPLYPRFADAKLRWEEDHDNSMVVQNKFGAFLRMLEGAGLKTAIIVGDRLYTDPIFVRPGRDQ